MPWGVKKISLLLSEVWTVAPLIVMSSTTREVNPEISVVAAAPKVSVWAPKETCGFAILALVTAPSVNCPVSIDWAVTEKVISLSSTSVVIDWPPVNVKVSEVLYWSVVVPSDKVINWFTVSNAKLPEPSVFKNCPGVPSAPGNVNVLDNVIELGAFNPM